MTQLTDASGSGPDTPREGSASGNDAPDKEASRTQSARPADPLEESRMPLWEHLSDLRQGIFRSLMMILVGFFVAYAYIEPIITFLEKPLLDLLPEGRKHLYFTGLTDKFFVYIKVSFLTAVSLCSPFLLFELWRFVSPGLYEREKKFMGPFIFFGSLAFFTGVAFAYYLVIPFGYKFLLEFGSPTDQAMITLTEYFSLTIKMMLALGVIFEVPVVMVLLGKIGVLNSDLLTRNRQYAFLACSVTAAIITPTPDAFTMLLVMGPLYLLYELGIVGVRWAQPKPSTD